MKRSAPHSPHVSPPVLGLVIAACACSGDLDRESSDPATSVIAQQVGGDCGPVPLAPVCNVPSRCTPDAGWIFEPLPFGTSCTTSDGQDGLCDGGDPGPPGSQEPLAYGACFPPGALDPRFYVLTVLYAPPGHTGGGGSTATYGIGSTRATQAESTKSFKQNYTQEATLGSFGFGLEGWLGDGSVNGGITLTTTERNSLRTSASASYGITKTGDLDGINHDDDEIVLWLNPRVFLFNGGIRTLWSLGVNTDEHTGTDVEIMPVKVAWLKGTQPMPPGVANELVHHGITPADYPRILEIDERAYADPTAKPDPDQFVRTGYSFPYQPPTTPTGTPLKVAKAIDTDLIATSSTTKSRDYDVGTSTSATLPIQPWLSLRLRTAGKWTWTHQTTDTATYSESERAMATIVGPSYGYTGPTTVIVYYDTMFRTFMFRFVPVESVPAVGGTVRSKIAEPLAGVSVFLKTKDRWYETITDQNGEYRFFEHDPGPAVVGLTRDVRLMHTIEISEAATATLDLETEE